MGLFQLIENAGRLLSGGLLFAALLVFPVRAESPPSSPSPATSADSSLTVDQIVDNLVRRDAERARALVHSEAKRTYRLTYHGFPSDRDAEMVVQATYDSPAKKNFRIISQTGSRLVLDHVFKRLLDSEREATAEPEIREGMLMNRENYDFALVGVDTTDKGKQFVLAVKPKTSRKYGYRGKIWVDAVDFAITRIDAEPATNPSFWTKKSEFHHEYTKVDGFWLPSRNESVSYVRLGGRATLTIVYENYRVVDARSQMSAKSTANAGH
jgi:hypothetical protein